MLYRVALEMRTTTHSPYNNNNNNSSRGNGNGSSTDNKNNNSIGIEYENEQKMIKLKDISAKLHKYFSKTFGVVNLNVEHTHTHSHTHMYIVHAEEEHEYQAYGYRCEQKHTMCSTNTKRLVCCMLLLFVCRVHETCSGIFVWFPLSFSVLVCMCVSFEKIVRVSC